jgi:hypothetical protein
MAIPARYFQTDQAFEIPCFMDGEEVAGEDLSGKQFTAVILTETGYVSVVGPNSRIDGILQNKPRAGEAALVMKSGISKMYTAQGFPYTGVQLGVDATGRAKSSTLVGETRWGVVRSRCAAAGQIIAVQFGFHQRLG